MDDRDEVVVELKGAGSFDYRLLHEALARVLVSWGSDDGETFTLRFRRAPDPGVLAVPYCPRWTREWPTVPGHYWIDTGWGDPTIEVVGPSNFTNPHDVGMVILDANGDETQRDQAEGLPAWRFAGPIPPPEPEG
jgi:hypothetical protein